MYVEGIELLDISGFICRESCVIELSCYMFSPDVCECWV